MMKERSTGFQQKISEIMFKTGNLDYDELHQFLMAVEKVPEDWIIRIANESWGMYKDKRKPLAYLSAIIKRRIEDEGVRLRKPS